MSYSYEATWTALEPEGFFIQTTTSEFDEMYLKVMWLSEEKGERLVKVDTISGPLVVSNRTAIQRLRKLEANGFVILFRGRGAELTDQGRRTGRQLVRNSRLIELLMSTVGTRVDESIACGMEHHMTTEFADALCSLLGHLGRCPHGYPIPSGRCCPK